jgi:hypothetical protein
MTEYMGMIYGEYDAKEGGGFVPGGKINFVNYYLYLLCFHYLCLYLCID